jgi:hypothetical protein
LLDLRSEGSTRVDTSRVRSYGIKVNLEPRLNLREKKDDTLGLEVKLDLETVPTMVYTLGLRRCRGGSGGFPLLQCSGDRTRSQTVRAHDELQFPYYL